MATMTRALALALVLAAAGCGGPPQLSVRIESIQPWALRADAESRILGVAGRAARFWGAGVEQLDGWLVVVMDGVVPCGDSVQVGCTDFWPLQKMTVSALAGEGWHPSCAEQTLLAHEVGHAILWTAGHDDARWSLLPAWQQADVAEHPDCL